MKKILSVVLMAALLVALCGCGCGAAEVQQVAAETQQEPEAKPEPVESPETEALVEETAPETEVPTIAPVLDFETREIFWEQISDMQYPKLLMLHEIENAGTVDIEPSSVKWELYGENDELLMLSTSVYAVPYVIRPGETAYLWSKIALDSNAHVSYAIPQGTVEAAYNDAVAVEVSDVSVKWTGSSCEVLGKVRPLCDALEVDTCKALALLRNAKGDIIGAVSGLAEHVTPERATAFALYEFDMPSWFSIGDVEDVEVFFTLWQ